MTFHVARTALAACAIWLLVGVAAASAEPRGISLIRDAEIENTIHAYAAPLMEAAGLKADSIDIHILNDDSLNAFVTSGLDLYINTGLLTATDGPGEIVGVIAHELGHVAGGHLIRTRDAIEHSSASLLIATVLGAGAVLAGYGDVGTAIIGGGQAVAQQEFLSYSRAQEQAADRAAVRFLERAGQSAEGLLKLFDRLEDQELLSGARQDPYLRTHPLTRERIRFVENHAASSEFTGTAYPDDVLLSHRRMVAKLRAFLEPSERVLRAYPPEHRSVEARYARAIALYRLPDLAGALAELDGLIAEYPEDPWFHELKGQILFENGRISESIAPYEYAVALREDEALLRHMLARAQIESGDTALRTSAIEHLERATQLEADNPGHWHYLGIAYRHSGDIALSALARAEAAYLRGRPADALHHAEVAAAKLPEGSPGWFRAKDIRNAIEPEPSAEE